MRRPLLVPILCTFALAACDAAPPAPAKAPQTQEDQQEEEASALREHIQTPIDKAKAVDEVREDHDSEQADTIDAAGAGDEVTDEEPVDDSSGG